MNLHTEFFYVEEGIYLLFISVPHGTSTLSLGMSTKQKITLLHNSFSLLPIFLIISRTLKQ